MARYFLQFTYFNIGLTVIGLKVSMLPFKIQMSRKSGAICVYSRFGGQQRRLCAAKVT